MGRDKKKALGREAFQAGLQDGEEAGGEEAQATGVWLEISLEKIFQSVWKGKIRLKKKRGMKGEDF